MSATATQTFRPIARRLRGQPTSDGAGVSLTRVIGTGHLPALDPFLMLDEFGSDRPGDYYVYARFLDGAGNPSKDVLKAKVTLLPGYSLAVQRLSMIQR